MQNEPSETPTRCDHFCWVASFVNPHDIVLFPAWARRGSPLEPSTLAPPNVPEAPTQHEDLATKPAAQIAFRDTYPSGYGTGSCRHGHLYQTSARSTATCTTGCMPKSMGRSIVFGER